MRVVVDEPKRVANLVAHGIDQNGVEAGFDFDAAVIAPTYPSRTGRERFKAIGPLDGYGLCVVVYSPLGNEGIGIVSVRRAGRKDRRIYDGE